MKPVPRTKLLNAKEISRLWRHGHQELNSIKISFARQDINFSTFSIIQMFKGILDFWLSIHCKTGFSTRFTSQKIPVCFRIGSKYDSAECEIERKSFMLLWNMSKQNAISNGLDLSQSNYKIKESFWQNILKSCQLQRKLSWKCFTRCQ